MLDNIVLMTDSYKFSHYKQYPQGTTHVYDYFESRGGKYSKVIFFGLQYFLKRYLSKPITQEDVEIAKVICDFHMGPNLFNYDMWTHIVNEHGGYLPVEIKALPEGTVLSVKNLLASIVNTDPKCYSLPGHLETLLMKVWAPITVSTTSLEGKKIIKKYLEETADNLDGLLFKLHDFGYRGVSSEESAGVNGMAHLMNFAGTDTVSALVYALMYYGGNGVNSLPTIVEKLKAGTLAMPGFSIPATEHSTMTTLGPKGEYRQLDNFIDVYSESPIKACVADSYNIYEFIDYLGTQTDRLKDGHVFVVRPDSGDPVKMSLECVQLLDQKFGHTLVAKGRYKLLNKTRVIYGDGISDTSVIEKILENAKQAGYSADNFAFGMGGGLLQKNDRDTQKFAIKCAAATINGELFEVSKNPITDPGKVSKKGYQDVIKVGSEYKTIQIKDYHSPNPESQLVTVYRNGVILQDYTIEEVRARILETM